jgi:hypothetical protein
VEAIRSNPELALGQPELVVDGVVNFVSLGFGGSITLAFAGPIANGPGADIRIDEATWGINPCNRYPETADVFASQNGINFVYLGRGCQDLSMDLGSLSWAQYVRIVDVSDVLSFRPGADGFDVNGVECLNGSAVETNDDGLVACSLQEIVSYSPGTRKNGAALPVSRTNPNNALGTPQNNNTINFVSLGFGGTLVAKFDYIVFNQPGNDLRITETSFGNPNCVYYPEKARISVSLDNINWVELGELCLDGEIDLGPVNYAQYIKIQDASPLSSVRFNGNADGFDVDAVMVINSSCTSTAARYEGVDNTGIADEEAALHAYPNPVDQILNLSISGLTESSELSLQVLDAAGRLIMQKEFVLDAEFSDYQLNVTDLSKGVYQVIVFNDSIRLVQRITK